jgi:RES domain-containing protein
VSGTLTVWRLVARQNASSALTGRGASRWGGRWNLPGSPVIYCSDSLALAAMEVLVHVGGIADLSALEWKAFALSVPEHSVHRPSRVPSSWRTYPYHRATQVFGSAWAHSGGGVALRVPSALVPGEFNHVLNCSHPEFAEVKVSTGRSFRFDATIRG